MDALRNVKFVHEKKILCKFYEEIAKDSGKYVFGLKDTMEALDNGMIDTLIMWENLEVQRLTLKDNEENITTENVLKEKITSTQKYNDKEIIDNVSLTEWLLNNFKKYVNYFEIVTDRSGEGNQFVKGFSGIGGILRFKVEQNFSDDEENHSFDEDDFI